MIDRPHTADRPSRAPLLASVLLAGALLTPVAPGQVSASETSGGPLVLQELSLPAVSTPSLAELRMAVGRVAAGAMLDRDWKAALEQVDAMRTQTAVAPGSVAARLALLVDLAANEVAFLNELGEPERALAATQALRVSVARDSPRMAELRQLAAAFVEHPDVLALRASLEAAVPDVEAGLLETVRKALRDEDRRLIEQLGSRAVPALEALARAGGDVDVEQPRRDPLYGLLMVDTDRAVALMHELAQAGRLDGYRGVMVMAYWDVLSKPEQWIARDPRPPRLRNGALIDVLEYCLDEARPDARLQEMFWNQVGYAMNRMAVVDAVPAPVAEACGRRAVSATPMPYSVLRSATSDNGSVVRKHSLRPFYEHLMAHPDDEVRAYVAEKLTDFPDSAALRAGVRDDEPRVRRALAMGLQQRLVRDGEFSGVGGGAVRGFSVTPLDPRIGDLERSLLRTLSRDNDPLVRVEVARALVDLEQPLEPRVYEALMSDSDGEVRLALTALDHPDAAVLRTVLLELATDPDPAVRRALAERREATSYAAVLGEALVVLSDDPDPSIRSEALRGLVTVSALEADPEAVLALLDDPDPSVRRLAVQKADADVVDLPALLLKAADDPDTHVFASTVSRLQSVLKAGDKGWFDDAGALLACMDILVRRDVTRFGPGDTTAVCEHPDGVRAVARWALDLDAEALWYPLERSSNRLEALADLDQQTFARLWSALCERDKVWDLAGVLFIAGQATDFARQRLASPEPLDSPAARAASRAANPSNSARTT